MVYAWSCYWENARRRYEHGASFPLGLTLEPCEELWILLSFGQCSINGSWLTEELLGLWIAVPRWMDNTLFGGPPLWSKKVKTDLTWWSELYASPQQWQKDWTVLKAPRFGFLLTLGKWPMAWPYGQAREQWKPGLLKGCSGRAWLCEFEECIKVEHINAHLKNALPSLEGD